MTRRNAYPNTIVARASCLHVTNVPGRAAIGLWMPILLAGCSGNSAPWRYDYLRNNYVAAGIGSTVSVDKHPEGLAGAPLALLTGGRTLILYGFEFYNIEGGRMTPVEASYLPREGRLEIDHKFDGTAPVKAVLSLDAAGQVLCSFGPMDHIGHIAAGRLDMQFETIAFDYGWVFRRPGRFWRERVMSDFLLGSDADNNHVLLACINGKRLIVDPPARRYSWQTQHRARSAVFVFAVGDDPVRLVQHYAQFRNHQPASYGSALVGRHLLDDWSELPFDSLIGLLDALRFSNATRLACIRHMWQHHGYDTKLPDTFPPNQAYGGLDALRRMGEYCNILGIPFGLHENFFDLYKDAPSYSEFAPAHQPREFSGGTLTPYYGWFNRATDQRALVHTPQSALAAMNRNLSQQKENLPVSTAFLDVTSYSDPLPLTVDDGQKTEPLDTLPLMRKLYADASALIRGPVIGEGCTEDFIGVVTAANLDLWSNNRWDSDSGTTDWDYSPVLAWIAHDKIIFHGAGYPPRYKQAQQVPLAPEMYTAPFADDYRSTAILFGSAPASFLTAQPYSLQLADILREYFLGVPFHQRVGLVPIIKVVHPDGNLHRSTVTYANNTSVMVNRDGESWQVGEYLLAQFGYRVEGPDYVQLAVLQEGHRLDVVRTKDLLYLDMRRHRRTFGGVTTAGRLAVEVFPDRCEILPIADIDSIQIDPNHFIVPTEQLGPCNMAAPDGKTAPVDRSVSGMLSFDAKDLELPAAATPFAPRYRKIVLQNPRSAPTIRPTSAPSPS